MAMEGRQGREGSRWFNVRPNADEVAEWFKSVPVHEGMDRERYIGGIVLIEQKMKTNEVDGLRKDGSPIIREGVLNLTYTPYPKVETRVQYFHDLMALHEDWMGVIEPMGGGEGDLPAGFSSRVIKGAQNSVTAFVCATMRVRVYERDSYREDVRLTRAGDAKVIRTGKTIIDAPPAIKMVPVLGYGGKPDPFSLMKAETGAVGRALGMAGMLVVPGAGVATADDMNEAQTLEGRSAPSQEAQPEAAQVPQDGAAQEDEEEALRGRATALINEMKAEYPTVFENFQAWHKAKKYGALADCNLLQLKGLVKKAEKDLDAARNAKG